MRVKKLRESDKRGGKEVLSRRGKAFRWTISILLILYTGIAIFVTVVTLLDSVKNRSDLLKSFIAIPSSVTFDAYKKVLFENDFIRYFGNSLIYALLITVITVYTSTIAGYVLCKYRFKGRDALFTMILMTMMIPGVVTLIPRYSIMQSLKWIDTYQALIVPSIFTAFGIFLMRQSCAVIPNELIEAARMDGANEFYIFHRIIIPQLNNAIVSMSVFQFLWAWDDYLWPFLMIRDTKKQLLPVALNLFSGQYSTDYAGLFAATSIAIIPVVIFYIIFQKKFIAGISSSAIKG